MSISSEHMSAFNAAFERAKASGRRNMNAMSLATVDTQGRPSVRSVLLRALDDEGLCFFTDARSHKARDLASNPHACLCVYWEPIEEQARVDGRVEPLSRAEIEADFASRPRAGQVLIMASPQTEPLDSLQTLRDRAASLDRSLPDPVPCPPHWTGFRLRPDRVELWKGARDRMHERTVFYLNDGVWHRGLLHP
ncbi:MAG: pyridoxamine 5'-phosphate oxidase [Gammaproteobacteria bacterium]|nr:pyridoxamine 5'-phosphate oxidase [Gammaproteobacteria bacterium]